VFIPANPYYSPGELGVGNRVNALAAVGIVTTVLAVGMVLGSVAWLLVGRVAHLGIAAGRTLATSAGLAVAFALGVGYAHEVKHDVYTWDLASHWQFAVVGSLRSRIPDPPAGSTIYAFGYPAYTAPGVPVFAASWDLNGAVKLLYRTGKISSYPAIAGVRMVCGATLIYPQGAGYTSRFGSAYGRAYLIDVSTGLIARPQTQAQCRREASHFAPGPLELLPK
jgi:hypothetical protein